MTATLVRALFRIGTRERASPVAPLPSCHETTDDHNRHARRCGRARARGRRLEPPAPDHAGRRPGARRPRPRRSTSSPSLGADVVKVNLYWDERRAAGQPQAGRLRRRRPRRLRLGQLRPRSCRRSSTAACGPTSASAAARPTGRPSAAAAAAPTVPARKEFGAFAQAAGQQFPERGHLVDLERGATSTPGSARSAARACPCRPGSTAASTSPATAACATRGHGDDTILLRRADAARRQRLAQGAPARVPARDGLPRPQLPPVPRRGRAQARLPPRRPHPDLRPRLPPLHAGQRARRERGRRRRRDRPAVARARARSTRSPAAASCRAACRSGSPSSATRPTRPTATARRSGARPR